MISDPADPGLVPLVIDRAAVRTSLRHGALALGGWLLLIVALAPLMPLSDTVVALGSPRQVLRNLPEGNVLTLGAGSVSVALAIEGPSQVRDLYRAGAWLVLPASRAACIEQRRTPLRPVI